MMIVICPMCEHYATTEPLLPPALAFPWIRTDTAQDAEIERMKREWWCARNEARRANRTPCLMVERAAQDILESEAAPS